MEQLVEIAHAVEQQHVGMLRLDAQVLLHHRRMIPGHMLRNTGVGCVGNFSPASYGMYRRCLFAALVLLCL